MNSAIRAGIVLASFLVIGCAPGRIADLRDSGRLSIGIGLGLSADAKLGDLTHPSLGLFSTAGMVGFDSRRVSGAYFDARTSEPYATWWALDGGSSLLGALNDSGWRASFETTGYGPALGPVLGPFRQGRPEDLPASANGEPLNGDLDDGTWLPLPPYTSYRTLTDLQLGAHLLVLGARIGINPLEIIDFAAGFVGLDPAGDSP